MKNLKQYLEESLNLADGIRLIESALMSLYKIQELDDKKSISRRLEHTRKQLLKASSFFGINEYIGNAIEDSLENKVKLSINILNKILTDFNNALDAPVTWGQQCLDIVASLNIRKEKNNDN